MAALRYLCVFAALAVAGISAQSSSSTARTTARPQNQTCNRNCTCGVNRYGNQQARIVGGKQVRPDEYPWRVALFKEDRNDKNKTNFFCAGTLISPNLVLTAAHCVYGQRSMINNVVLANQFYKPRERHYAVVGFTDITGQPRKGVTAEVSLIRSHESYKQVMLLPGMQFENDIALLLLNRYPAYSDTIRPACLPFALRHTVFENLTAIATGWGKNKEGAEGNLTSVLNVAEIPILDYNRCRRNTSFLTTSLFINNNTYCAYKPGQDTCQGDSGGGVDTRGNCTEMYTTGIVSWGWGCARENNPGVYTKVDNYLDWIVKAAVQLWPGTTFCGQN